MHAIEYLEFSSRKTDKGILKDCSVIANRNGDYKGQIESNGITLKDKVLKNRKEAEDWIKLNDVGWYHNLGIKFRDGTRIKWLVKIEYHC